MPRQRPRDRGPSRSEREETFPLAIVRTAHREKLPERSERRVRANAEPRETQGAQQYSCRRSIEAERRRRRAARETGVNPRLCFPSVAECQRRDARRFSEIVAPAGPAR